MTLIPSISELVSRAREDLRHGIPILVKSNGSCALVVAVEGISEDRLKAALHLEKTQLTITARRAQALGLGVEAHNGDFAHINLEDRPSIEVIKSISDPAHPSRGKFALSLKKSDVPLITISTGIALAKAAQILPALIIGEINPETELELRSSLTLLNAEIALPLLSNLAPLRNISNAHVPLSVSNAGRVHVFRPNNGTQEHFAIEIGSPDRSKPVLARLHSACFTGDIFGSLKCDCGPQLHAALSQMGEAGEGILLYLNQEGRGIGHANKMRAYNLQELGVDTVQANHHLGFEDDERDFRIGASILKEMGFSEVSLLTNNPNKIKRMEENGIKVTERIALQVGKNKINASYLDTKARKSGHLL